MEVDHFKSNGVPLKIHELRCSQCKGLLGKTAFNIQLPPKFYQENCASVTQIYPEVKIEFYFEMKCRRCKALDYRVTVI